MQPHTDAKMQRLLDLEAQIRDQRRLGGPTGALQHAHSKLLASLDKAAVEAQKRAHEALLLEERWRKERWRKEHYNRRDT